MVQWCWVNFQCQGVLLIWIRVGQGPTTLAVGAGGGCLDIFSLVYHFSFLSPSLWKTARYRLKYRLEGPLSPTLPTNQLLFHPILNFCPLTWHFCGETNIKKLEKIQERALRFIYNDFDSNYESRLFRSKMPTLKLRRLRTMALEIFKSFKPSRTCLCT